MAFKRFLLPSSTVCLRCTLLIYHLKLKNSTDLTAKDGFLCALISFCLLAIYIIEFHKCGIQTFVITIINSLFEMHFANKFCGLSIIIVTCIKLCQLVTHDSGCLSA